jgi:hypothetical protein
VICNQTFPEHHDKGLLVSKELPLSILKGPSKKAGVSLNDWALGCCTQAVGLLGGDKETGQYLGIQWPIALHKAEEI